MSLGVLRSGYQRPSRGTVTLSAENILIRPPALSKRTWQLLGGLGLSPQCLKRDTVFWQSGNGLADTPFEGELFGKIERLFCMKNIFILVSLFLAVNFAHSASFDCKKATTSHEKFICNSQELNEVDTQLGATYSSVLKSFKFPELIKEDQRSWLNEYRNCGALTKCLNLAKSRTTELKKYSKATVYTDYKENKFLASEGTIIIFDESGTINARFLGNWMSDMAMDPNKIKGYPFDGKWCDLDVELLKKENVFISKDSSEEISLSIDPSKIIMKGQLMCSPRTGFGEGTYLKR